MESERRGEVKSWRMKKKRSRSEGLKITTEIGKEVCGCRCLAAYHSVSVCG